METPSRFKELIYLYDIPVVITSIVAKTLTSSGMYLTGTLVWYTLQIITKAWIKLAQAAGMRLFYKKFLY